MLDPESFAMVLMTAAIILLCLLVPIMQAHNNHLERERRQKLKGLKWND